MVDITYKSSTHRIAIAEAIVSVSASATITAVKEKRVPKGDVFEMSKTAGLFAAKKTSDIIPDCHPLPIEFTQISFEIKELQIHIRAEIHTIYKTGVEVEAMHTASVVALTMYDMLKPIDKMIEIRSIKLIEKKGGKSDYMRDLPIGLTASVIVCSDTISKGQKEDMAGKAIIKKLENSGVLINDYIIIPDEKNLIYDKAKELCAKSNLVIFTGGTGLSSRDVTPDALKPLIDIEIPGIAEAIRSYGQQRTPYSMLSRSLAGLHKNTLIMALPGSTKGASESMDAVFPSVLHLFRIMRGARHN